MRDGDGGFGGYATAFGAGIENAVMNLKVGNINIAATLGAGGNGGGEDVGLAYSKLVLSSNTKILSNTGGVNDGSLTMDQSKLIVAGENLKLQNDNYGLYVGNNMSVTDSEIKFFEDVNDVGFARFKA